MAIIDEFIIKNQRVLTDAEMGLALGMPKDWVWRRRKQLVNKDVVRPKPITLSDEAVALINLIEVRKTGWAVDIAKQRLKDLAKVINKL